MPVKPKNLVIVSTLPQSALLTDKEIRELYSGYYEKATLPLPVMRLIMEIGHNTGNYFFNEAVVRHLGYGNCAFIEEAAITNADPGFLRENVFAGFESVVYPSANLIRPHDIPHIRLLLERVLASTDKPVTVLGAGSQVMPGQEANKDMLKTLARVADRSYSIGVRGENSADILYRAGIGNVDVIGCPSAFYSMDPAYRITKKPLNGSVPKVAYTGELDGRGIDFVLNREHSDNSFFIMQNEPLFFYRSTNPDAGWDEMEISETLNDRYAELPAMQVALLDRLIREKGKIFSCMHDWIASMREFDFCFGPRFHGNMAAMQAGVPALWIRHDNRTRELIDFLCLPSVTYEEAGDLSIDCLYDLADYSAFNKIYPSLFNKYRLFLEYNSVSHVLPVVSTDLPEGSELRRELHNYKLITENRALEEKNKTLDTQNKTINAQNRALEQQCFDLEDVNRCLKKNNDDLLATRAVRYHNRIIRLLSIAIPVSKKRKSFRERNFIRTNY